MSDFPWTKEDWCYECRGNGDDYYFDDDGELVCFCDECSFNEEVMPDENVQDNC